MTSVDVRGVAVLRSTRAWALCVGIVALVGAALAVVNALIYGFGLPFDLPAKTPPYYAVLTRIIGVAGAVIGLVVYGLSGWFALHYGRGIGASLRAADAGRLEAALGWQRRYWTFQGVVMIAFIALYVLGFIAAIVVGVISAMHHQGF